MSAASVERPHDERPLIAEANRLMDRLPGYRVEIIGGRILASPPPDGPHARALTTLMLPFVTAGPHGGETEVLQCVGLWLPTDPEDHAIPDPVVVDSDVDDHLVENNCYDPVCFRLVLEVTSSNWKNDLKTKVAAYAAAKVPVHVVVDRKHQRVHVLTDPVGDEYVTHRFHSPGQLVTLPDSIGAKVTLDVTEVLRAGRPRTGG
ncbi:integral membrane protein [Streptomyces viridosporus ATCC 14672]|uniref:Integral membrane protein n=1 Tax=Streptomyces viridosporus (strain ATCC 14672 / DSM 40746 / JCM 4963 / KCTC 9882 / NRRL B-12104 / FH 1290) TaxID=566461 RepID=D6A1Y1_STRV1|nr:Uma2 family endonuclease [Streptomyces viridosporus]EFE67523.1 integral membrane protein [Streptomyces viridosporus ATCC 14672]